METISRESNYKKALLVSYKDKLIPLATEDIAYFYTEYKIVKAVTFSNTHYVIDDSLEKISRYKNLTHGEGVAIGMCAVAKSGERLGITEAGTYKRIKDLLSALGLPYATDTPLTEIAEGIRSDKKRLDGKLTLVLLKKIGEGMLKQIKEDEIPLYIGGD